MNYRILADAAVVLHFGFLVFLVVGGLAALRWRRLVWPHVAAVAWGVGIVTVGQRCPLTALERWATARAGEDVPAQGFIDRYVEDVVYPGSLTGPVRAGVALVVCISWVMVWHRSGWVGLRPGSGRRPGDRRPQVGRQGLTGGR